jgi:hypothetical protein
MILFNDASIHGQFDSIDSFRQSLRTLWNIRSHLDGKGLQLKVCRSLRQRQVTQNHSFNDFLGFVPRDIKTRLLIWISKEGPFWDDDRRHSSNEYFECCGDVVTDTGAAEAAFSKTQGMDGWLFSIVPSNFQFNPLSVSWRGRHEGDLEIEIPNGWSSDHAESCATEFERPFASWDELLDWVSRECPHLLLSQDIPKHLPTQFIPNVAQRSKVLLCTLNRMVELQKGGNDQEFNQMRCDWMQGDQARFSSSSDTELREFSNELTFRHPETLESVVCSWHGKIKTPQYRIHFEWPLPTGSQKLFIAYIGPKITKR